MYPVHEDEPEVERSREREKEREGRGGREGGREGERRIEGTRVCVGCTVSNRSWGEVGVGTLIDTGT